MASHFIDQAFKELNVIPVSVCVCAAIQINIPKNCLYFHCPFPRKQSTIQLNILFAVEMLGSLKEMKKKNRFLYHHIVLISSVDGIFHSAFFPSFLNERQKRIEKGSFFGNEIN